MARFRDLPKHEWKKDDDNQTWRKVTSQYDTGWITFTIQDLIDTVTKLGLVDVEFEVESDYMYGEQTTVMKYSGWRLATQNEVTQALDELNRERADLAVRKKAHEDRQIAELRALRPELFK